MKLLLVAPLVLPLITALSCTLVRSKKHLQTGVSLAGALAFLFCAVSLMHDVLLHGAVEMVAGNWPAGFGIGFMVDRLSAMLIVLTAFMIVAAVFWQFTKADAAPHFPMLHPLLHGLVAGVGGAFITEDLFNLYL